MIRHLALNAVLAALLCTQGIGAQEPEPQAVFKSESDLVILHVNVFDGRSDAVPDLAAKRVHRVGG